MLAIGRLDACKACGAELHACRMCMDYAHTVAKKCREPVAEEVFEKERANFCDFYQPRPDAYVAHDTSAATRARSALDELFGGVPAIPAPPGDRAALDALFRKS